MVLSKDLKRGRLRDSNWARDLVPTKVYSMGHWLVMKWWWGMKMGDILHLALAKL